MPIKGRKRSWVIGLIGLSRNICLGRNYELWCAGVNKLQRYGNLLDLLLCCCYPTLLFWVLWFLPLYILCWILNFEPPSEKKKKEFHNLLKTVIISLTRSHYLHFLPLPLALLSSLSHSLPSFPTFPPPLPSPFSSFLCLSLPFKVSCNPGCLQTHYIVGDEYELWIFLSLSCCKVLGIQTYNTTSS